MHAAGATAQQIKMIHTLKGRAGLDDDTYRDLLEREGKCRSSTALSSSDAWRVIEHLKVVTGQGNGPAEKPGTAGALRLSGPYVAVCRALWLAGYNLGVVDDRRDVALVAFVEGQTGLKSLNWMRDHKEAKSVIEALKSWIARVAGVAWDADTKSLRERGITLARWRKTAVIRAQYRLLGEPAVDPRDAPDRDLDAIIAELGKRVRAARERRARA